MDIPDMMSPEEEALWSKENPTITDDDYKGNELDINPDEPEVEEETSDIQDGQEEENLNEPEKSEEKDLEQSDGEDEPDDSNLNGENENEPDGSEVDDDITKEQPNGENEEEPNQTSFTPFKLKADGVEIPIESLDELEKLASQGVNYTRKMQDMAPFRKQLSAMVENNINEDDINLLIEAKGGSKEALATLINQAGVDALDIDAESANGYKPKQYGLNENQIELKDIVSQISSDTEYAMTENIVDKKWDDKSRGILEANPKAILDLHEDIKSGDYKKYEAEALKMKMMYGAQYSDVEYYAHVRNNDLAAKKQERETKNSDAVEKEIARRNKQEKINKSSNKKKAAATPKSKAGSNKSTVDYLNSPDEDYEAWYKDVMSRV